MHDPCEPHHYHGPARVLGRIHRHHTGHIAKHLPAHPGACLAGAKPSLAAPLLKVAAPAAAFVALAAIAPALIISSNRASLAPAPAHQTMREQGAGNIAGGLPAGGTFGGFADPRVTDPHGADPRARRHRREPEPVDEPPTWALLVLAAAGCFGFRRWFRAG
jgi:hypothetical protein